jgi:hypothetical protein
MKPQQPAGSCVGVDRVGCEPEPFRDLQGPEGLFRALWGRHHVSPRRCEAVAPQEFPRTCPLNRPRRRAGSNLLPSALILLGFLADFDGLCTFCALFGVISGRTQEQNCGASSADRSVHIRTALPSVKLCALSKADPEPSVFRSNAALALACWRKAARGR